MVILCDTLRLIGYLGVTQKKNMLSLFKVHMNPEAAQEVAETLNSGMITQAGKVAAFEQALSEYFDHPYILTLNSATSGLTMAYRLLDLEPDSEVIATPLTCFATTTAVLANNLSIKWADTDPQTCNIDLDDVRRKITAKTRALSFVHWGGSPVDLDYVDELKRYAKKQFGTDLGVVEDCAHAFGATFKDKALGTHGNIAVYSLQAIKHLTTGDGGLIFLPNREMYERAKLLRWYGIDREYRSGKDFRLEQDIPEYGYKFHMNDIAATIGLANLRDVPGNIERHRANAAYYDEAFATIPWVQTFPRDARANPAYWIYTLRVPRNMKDAFILHLKKHGVMASQVHARNDRNSCVRQFQTSLPQLDMLEPEIVSIPVGWWMSRTDLVKVVKTIKEFTNEYPEKTFQTIRSAVSSDFVDYQRILGQLSPHVAEAVEVTGDELEGVYVDVRGGTMVSTARLVVLRRIGGCIGLIEDVVVDSEYRGRGLGRQMVRHLIRKAEEAGCYKTVLSCKTELAPFYDSCGMEKEGEQMVSRNS